MSPTTQAKKAAKGLCCHPFCRRKSANHSHQCNRCRKRKWREAHPIHYLFDNLRTHARERGKSFTLTLAEFEAFCLETGYHLTKGRHAAASSIDRRDNSKGYEKGNLRILSHGENSARKDSPDIPPYSVTQYAPGEDPLAA